MAGFYPVVPMLLVTLGLSTGFLLWMLWKAGAKGISLFEALTSTAPPQRGAMSPRARTALYGSKTDPETRTLLRMAERAFSVVRLTLRGRRTPPGVVAPHLMPALQMTSAGDRIRPATVSRMHLSQIQESEDASLVTVDFDLDIPTEQGAAGCVIERWLFARLHPEAIGTCAECAGPVSTPRCPHCDHVDPWRSDYRVVAFEDADAPTPGARTIAGYPISSTTAVGVHTVPTSVPSPIRALLGQAVGVPGRADVASRPQELFGGLDVKVLIRDRSTGAPGDPGRRGADGTVTAYELPLDLGELYDDYRGRKFDVRGGEHGRITPWAVLQAVDAERTDWDASGSRLVEVYIPRTYEEGHGSAILTFHCGVVSWSRDEWRFVGRLQPSADASACPTCGAASPGGNDLCGHCGQPMPLAMAMSSARVSNLDSGTGAAPRWRG